MWCTEQRLLKLVLVLAQVLTFLFLNQPPQKAADHPACHLCVQDTAAGEAVSPAVGSYSHTFAAALHALLPPAAATQPEQQQQNGHVSSSAQQSEALAGGGLSQLLLIGHHPAITAGVSKKLGAWQAACNRLTGISAELKGGGPGVHEEKARLQTLGQRHSVGAPAVFHFSQQSHQCRFMPCRAVSLPSHKQSTPQTSSPTCWAPPAWAAPTPVMCQQHSWPLVP